LALILLKSETDNIHSMCTPDKECTGCESENDYFANKHSIEFQWKQLKLAEQCCRNWRLKLMKKKPTKLIPPKIDAT